MSHVSESLHLVKPLRMRWVMVGLAFLATVLNYVHRLSFNYLSADGPLREAHPGRCLWVFRHRLFCSLHDIKCRVRFCNRPVRNKSGLRLVHGLLDHSGTAPCIFVVTPFQFGICRFLLGIGEAGNWPAAIRLTTEWFPPHERSTASGIFNSGAALGAIIVPPLVAYLGVRYGWQSTFIILAAFGYLWLVVFWFTYYTPRGLRKRSQKEKSFHRSDF